MMLVFLLAWLYQPITHPGQVLRFEAVIRAESCVVMYTQLHDKPVYTNSRMRVWYDPATKERHIYVDHNLDGQACVVIQYCGQSPTAVQGRWTDVGDIVLVGTRLLRVDQQSYTIGVVTHDDYLQERLRERGY